MVRKCLIKKRIDSNILVVMWRQYLSNPFVWTCTALTGLMFQYSSTIQLHKTALDCHNIPVGHVDNWILAYYRDEDNWRWHCRTEPIRHPYTGSAYHMLATVDSGKSFCYPDIKIRNKLISGWRPNIMESKQCQQHSLD